MIKIREIQTTDTENVLAILNYYISDTDYNLDYQPLTLSEFEAKINAIKTKEYPFLVLEEDEQILGFAYLDSYNPKVGYDITADLTIYLKPNLKRRGYGTMLFDSLIMEAYKMKIENLISIISETNISSVKFHQKKGFKKVAYLDNIAIKNDKYVGVFYYRKKL